MPEQDFAKAIKKAQNDKKSGKAVATDKGRRKASQAENLDSMRRFSAMIEEGEEKAPEAKGKKGRRNSTITSPVAAEG